VQQRDEIWKPSRESKPSVSGLFSLTPGFSRVPTASNDEAVSTAFHPRKKLLKQFVVSIAAYTGLKPGVNAK
jgi:hypothetical protein